MAHSAIEAPEFSGGFSGSLQNKDALQTAKSHTAFLYL
jgi:hypothetical protein